MNRIARWIYRGRTPILAGVLIAALCGAVLLPRLRLSFSLVPLIEANETERAAVEVFDEDFPTDYQNAVVMLDWPDEIGAAEVATLGEIGARLTSRPEIRAAVSLANAPVVVRTPVGILPTSFGRTIREGETARAAAQRHPILLDRLVSRDGRGAVILVHSAREDANDTSFELLHALESELPRAVPEGVSWEILAPDVARRTMRDYMIADLRRSLGLAFAIFALLLPLIFRSVRGVVVPLGAVLVSLAVAAALLVLSGGELNLIEVAVPGIMAAIGLCDAIHLQHRFEEAIAAGAGRRRAVLLTIRKVGLACFFTSFTTAIGFLSLLVADHAAVRIFGIKAAIAVMLTFVLVVVTVPAALSFWPVRGARLARVPGIRFGGLPRARPVLVATALVTVFAVLGIDRVRVDSRWLEEMPADDPLVLRLARYERDYSGLLGFDVRVRGDLGKLEHALAVERLASGLLTSPGVNRVESYVDWVREAAGQPERLTQAELSASLERLAAVESVFPRHLLRPDLRAARLAAFTDDAGSSRFFRHKAHLEALARELPDGVEAEVAGFMLMANRSSRLLVTTMLESFAISLLVISVFIALLYRSVRIGLVAIVPNVLPVLVALGVQGWLDVPLRIGIVMIYSLGLGLAVDDTIHVLTRYRQERRSGPGLPPRIAIERSLRSAGSALVVTTAVILVEALCCLPSSFNSLRDVGTLLGLIVVTALLADLFLLPVLLERATRSRRPPTASGRS
ncbi:MAG: MMPL family transporter [Planctomycetota bacterium]